MDENNPNENYFKISFFIEEKEQNKPINLSVDTNLKNENNNENIQSKSVFEYDPKSPKVSSKLSSGVTYSITFTFHTAKDLPISDSAPSSATFVSVSIDGKEYLESNRVEQNDCRAKWEETVVVTNDLQDLDKSLHLKVMDYYNYLYESSLLGIIIIHLKDIPFGKKYTKTYNVDSSPYHNCKTKLKISILITSNQKLHILDKLEMLQSIQDRLAINGKAFQPNKKSQSDMILKSVSAKLVSAVIKKELKLLLLDSSWTNNESQFFNSQDSVEMVTSDAIHHINYSYNLKITLHSIDDLNYQNLNNSSDLCIGIQLEGLPIGHTKSFNGSAFSNNVELDSVFTVKDLNNLNQIIQLQLLTTDGTSNSLIGSESLKLMDLGVGRVKTIKCTLKSISDSLIVGKVVISMIITKEDNKDGNEDGYQTVRPFSRSGNSEFVKSLRKNVSLSQFEAELKFQSENQTKNSSKVFESFSSGFKSGLFIQVNSRNKFEDLNLSSLVVSNQMSNYSSSRLEDASSPLIKKDGMIIIVDPSFYTGEHKIKLIISFKRPIDISNHEDVTKEHFVWSTKNYSFGLKLTDEFNSGYNPPDNCSLPGWQGRSPIFIPAVKCQIRVVVDASPNAPPIEAKTLYHLTNFKIFTAVCNNTKHGIKLLSDHSIEFFKTQAANTLIPGGFSALNMAALHGNLEVYIID